MLLELKKVTKEYPLRLRRGNAKSKIAVKNVSFAITKGESVGLVGESGSGKSTLAKCMMRLEKITSGQVLWKGQSIYSKRFKDFTLYKNIQMVLQDSSASLHPKMRVAEILAEPIRNFFPDEKNWHEEGIKLLHLVGLDASFLNYYPDQLSGGQKQRVCIAKALAVKPELIIFDESIASLDSPSQKSILEILKKIQKLDGPSYLFITHDLESTKELCDRVAIMYEGEIVETLTDWENGQLTHPYSRLLFDTMDSYS
ncbi:dipeptide/oligopeptide/nickel ABC transporter ATP-binding protein [Ureibacillus sp. BA0131]|uniref:Dipeptide/oligopeptide/nickel ABC transporter ATP-binding protein n=1 Tax=Ureibacillus aquaedulcis TaxID=3058421 RepID=A0ABT8GP78_9BACL|nr:dipeptide/oligopeptide/nickel ABC transporter ATP-binding protein [Ureibacillus sp. BA0131]MDN4493034.1 dipeptide/oligopeptide/nickel ABC transporter ATP-binding protein [Ureibacillus sp. BA0131]